MKLEKIVSTLAKSQARTDKEFANLARSQARTDKKLAESQVRADKRFAELSENMDKVIVKLVEMDGKIDRMVTRDEFDGRMEEVSGTLDGHTVILQRLDQERTVTNHRLDRLEGDVRQIKPHVGLA